jgi:branched-chain amino acid transport system substrate-binding protein
MKKRCGFGLRKSGTFGLAFLFVLVAFSVSSFGAEKVIRFGAAVALTGKFSREGEMLKRSYDLWMELANAKGGINVGGVNHKVEIKYYDDQSDIMTSSKLVEKLITVDGIDFILGPYGSGATFASTSVAEKYERIMVCQATAQTVFSRGYRYIFNFLASTLDYQRYTFMFASTLKPAVKRAAITYQNVLYGQLVGKSAQGFAKQHGMEIVLEEAFESGTKDLSSLVVKLAHLKPDILSITGYQDETTLLVRQMKAAKAYIPLVSVAYGPDLLEWRKGAGDAGIYVSGETFFNKKRTDCRDKIFGTAADFAKIFREKNGFLPSYDDACACTAGLALQFAIEKAKSLDPKKVRDALASLDENTILGRLKFNPDGTRFEPAIYITQIQAKDTSIEPIIVYPEAYKEGNYVYPLPPWDKR